MQISFSWQKVFGFLKDGLTYLLIFLLIYTGINWWRQPKMPIDSHLQLQNIQGEILDITKMSEEKPVLIYFWGTWCGVCRQTSPMVNRLAQKGNYPVLSIAVNSGEDSDITQYMHQKNLTFSTINDSEGKIFSAWQGQVTPSYVILQNGKMEQGFTGIQPTWVLLLRLKLAQIF